MYKLRIGMSEMVVNLMMDQKPATKTSLINNLVDNRQHINNNNLK